jgi:Protein of unknown function (Hypoth_ymh)
MAARYIEGAYARLKGLRDAAASSTEYGLHKSFGTDYTTILQGLRKNSKDAFEGFDLDRDSVWEFDSTEYHFNSLSLRSKIHQLIQYLELVHLASTRIAEIGSVYNSIKDEELKSRCSDLLSAPGHFDRVINQATQVLEERIRAKVPEFQSDVGLALVGKAINGEPSKSRIVFSDNAAEQDGYAAIFRGLIGAFRNPTHHRFIENVTREQALQICAFIDNMLAALQLAQSKSDQI